MFGFSSTATGSDATVSGGSLNTASGYISTVSGGYRNTASGDFSTVSGDRFNTASGYYSTVAGNHNESSGNRSTVSGGLQGSASGNYATVSGGWCNSASAYGSTVPGGLDNRASGEFSFAAGRTAKANHAGSFVWGGIALSFNKTSSAADQFNVYAEGGMRMFAVGQTTPSMEVAADGNVGIGTASPTDKLHVAGSTDGDLRIDHSLKFGLNTGIDATSENGDAIHFFRFNGVPDVSNLYLHLGDDPTPGVNTDAFIIQVGGDDKFAFFSDGAAAKPGGGSWASLAALVAR